MTIQITIRDYEELRELAQQVLSGDQSGAQPQSVAGTGIQPEPTVTESPVVPPKLVGEPAATTEPVQEQKPEAAAIPEATPDPEPVVYSLDDLTKAGISLMDAGKKKELQDLLMKYGAPSLPALDKSQFEAFAGDLRSLGAAI